MSTRWIHLILVGVCISSGIFFLLYQVSVDDSKRSLFGGKRRQSNRFVKPAAQVQKCKEHQTIGFLKTHKTASSTVQNIFLRYGLSNDLDFVLPSSGNHLNNPEHFYENMEKFIVKFLDEESSNLPWHQTLKSEQGYKIFALHSLWNYEEVSSLLGSDAIFVTILRNPSDVFESLYSYMKFEEKLKLSISQYIKMLNASTTLYQHRISGYLGLNQQLFDLGQSDLYNLSQTEETIKIMEKNFDLVMIAEHFDESLVLLADILCWPLEKLTSFKVNARKEEKKKHLSKKEVEILSHWQQGEEMVYQHFKKKLEQKMTMFGDQKMLESVARLRRMNDKLTSRCVQGLSDKEHLKSDDILAPWSPDVVAFKVTSDDKECNLLAMSENSLIDKVRQSQTLRWKKKLRKNSKIGAKNT